MAGEIYGGVDSYLRQLEGLQNEGLGAAQHSSGQGSAMDSYLATLGAQQSGEGMVNVPLMAFAAGLGAPTRTGSFGESLSNGFSSTIPQINAQRQAELQRGEAMMKIQQAKADLANQLFQHKLGLMDLPFQGLTRYNQGLKDQQNIDFLQSYRSAAAGAKPQTVADDTTPDVTQPPTPATTAADLPSALSAGQTVAAVQAPGSAGTDSRIAAARAGVEGQSPFGGAAPAPTPAAPAPTQAQADIPDAQATPAEGGAPANGYVMPGGGQTVAATATPKSPGKVVSDVLKASPINPVGVPPMPQGYKPNARVDLGDGAIGYRPPASEARRLDNAYRMTQMGLQYPGSSDAGAMSGTGQKIMDDLTKEGWTWDPQNKVLVPLQKADPRYQADLEGKKENAKLGAQDAHTLVEIPDPRWNGPAELAPKVMVPKAYVQAQGNAALRTGNGDFTMKEQSPLTVAGANEFAKQVQTLPSELTKAQQAVENGEHAKDLLKNYPTGALADLKQKVVAIGKSVGLTIDEKDMKGWSPNNWEQLNKLAMRQVFDDVASLGGRVLVSEIQGFQQATYGPGLQPESNRAIMSSLNAQTKYKAAYLQDFVKWRESNPYNIDPSKFAAEWTKAHPYGDFYNHEMTTTIAPGAPPIEAKYYAPPPVSERMPGMEINSPKGVARWVVREDGTQGWELKK